MGKGLVPRKGDRRDEKLFPKNNYFCYRWRVIDNFNKTVERELFELHLTGGSYHQSLQNDRILTLYKMCYRKRKNDFISQLTQDALSFLETRRSTLSRALQEESAYTKSMAVVVDSLFNILLSCSIELNTVLGFSELFIAATEPELQTYTTNGRSKVRSLNCHLSTNMFSLVLHGQTNRIEFYLLPVEDIFANQHPSTEHEPIITCIGEVDGDTVKWKANIPQKNLADPYAEPQLILQDLTDEVMENVCHHALKYLVESTQTVLSRTTMPLP